MQKILFSKAAIIILIIIVLYVGFSALKQYRRKSIGANELETLQQEIAELQKNNSDLASLIKYLESPDFAEEEARSKLNLKKSGEQVVVVPRVEGKSVIVDSVAKQDDKSNPVKWFDYFFEAKAELQE